MKAKPDQKFFLVISGTKTSRSVQRVLSRMSEENPCIMIKVVSIRKAGMGQVEGSLRQAVRRGAQSVYILPMGNLPKRALRDDLPLAIRRFREKHMAIDFHYVGAAGAGTS